MISDDLKRFGAVTDADCQHRAISVDRRKPEYLPHIVCINIMLVKLITNLFHAYNAFDFNKCASRCLIPFLNCFSRRFDHKTFRERLLVGAMDTSLRTVAWLRSAKNILLIRCCYG